MQFKTATECQVEGSAEINPIYTQQEYMGIERLVAKEHDVIPVLEEDMSYNNITVTNQDTFSQTENSVTESNVYVYTD